MSEHKQPTKEELEAENQRLLQEIETAPEATPEEEETPVETPAPEETPEKEVVTPEPEPETPKEEAPKEEDKDYKEKFAASTREAQRLYRDNLEVGKAFEEAAKVAEPNEDELKQEYPEWEDMTLTEQKLAKDNLANKKRWAIVEKAQEKVRTDAEWQGKIDEYVEDPETLVKYPDLEGKVERLRDYAKDKKQVQPGTDFSLVVKSFLYEQAKIAPPKNKGAMFETGSGGPNDKPKPKDDKISLAEAETLKQTNFKKYLELLKAKKIASE